MLNKVNNAFGLSSTSMNTLGDLLLSHPKPKDNDSSNGATSPAQDQKIYTERVEKNICDAQSNASSTDDYVNELLDPNDRQRNVWHVVEGPKIDEKTADENEGESQNGVSSNDRESKDLEELSAKKYCDDGERDREIDLDRNNYQRNKQDDDNHNSYRNHDKNKGYEDIDVKREFDRDVDKVGDSGRELDEGRDRHKERDKNRDRDRHRSHRDERNRDKNRDKERDRERNKERERDRVRDHGKSRVDRDRDDDCRSSSSRHRSSRRRHDYSDDDDYDYDRSRRSRRDRTRSKASSSSRRRERSRSNSQSPVTKRNSRTILIMQLNPKVNSRDLEEFFSEIGKVREVRLIMDSKTRRHKGIAYIEFEDAASAEKAFSLNGQRFFDAPIVIQSAQLDRNNRSSGDRHSSSTSHPAYASSSSRSNLPPNCYRVYVGGLNVNLTEDMIRSIFEPFGPIVRLELMRDRTTNVSRGYAFITYARIEDGQEAVQNLNGFELAGKALRVSKSTEKNERHSTNQEGGGHHDSDSDGRSSRVKDVTASLYELAGH